MPFKVCLSITLWQAYVAPYKSQQRAVDALEDVAAFEFTPDGPWWSFLATGGFASSTRTTGSGDATVTSTARKTLKKRGMMYGPHTLTMAGSAVVHNIGVGVTDEQLAEHVARIYKDVKNTATEFNARGDLFTGSNIQGFLRVANVMMTHGAV